MITDFGKVLRKLRIDKGLKLYDMAQRLGKSSAWLSYIETGRRKVPMGLADEIADLYSLAAEERKMLNDAASRSVESFKFNIGQNPSEIRYNTAYALARNFEEIDDATLAEFMKLLQKKEKD